MHLTAQRTPRSHSTNMSLTHPDPKPDRDQMESTLDGWPPLGSGTLVGSGSGGGWEDRSLASISIDVRFVRMILKQAASPYEYTETRRLIWGYIHGVTSPFPDFTRLLDPWIEDWRCHRTLGQKSLSFARPCKVCARKVLQALAANSIELIFFNPALDWRLKIVETLLQSCLTRPYKVLVCVPVSSIVLVY